MTSPVFHDLLLPLYYPPRCPRALADAAGESHLPSQQQRHGRRPAAVSGSSEAVRPHKECPPFSAPGAFASLCRPSFPQVWRHASSLGPLAALGSLRRRAESAALEVTALRALVAKRLVTAQASSSSSSSSSAPPSSAAARVGSHGGGGGGHQGAGGAEPPLAPTGLLSGPKSGPRSGKRRDGGQGNSQLPQVFRQSTATGGAAGGAAGGALVRDAAAGGLLHASAARGR